MDFYSPPDLEAMRETHLPAQRAEVEAALAARPKRSLHPNEIDRLLTQGNSAEDWASVTVGAEFDPASIQHSRFEGDVALGQFGAASGIFHSTIRDCAIGDGVRISRCGLVSRQVIGDGACLEDVHRIEAKGDETLFGNDLVLFHEELFSRLTRVVAEVPFEWAAWISGPGAAARTPAERAPYEQAIEDYTGRMRSSRGLVGRNVKIVSSTLIENCWLGEGVQIEGIGSLRNCTVWAMPEAETILRDGIHARNCLIGPGCVVERGATIEDSIFFEQVFVGQQAIVRGCAVGPNSRLSASEANDSLLGPFTMAIHHGLILAAWWPEGKGNIAYGSNVGSNHTGRAPDQEIFPGEGLFFGLGCNVKFPCCFTGAPYTIIASGVNVLPQKVEFPFSLITEPTQAVPDLSPALNEIQPGWGLIHNAYGIERQERNMAQRNRARRQNVETRILRPGMIPRLQGALLAMQRPAEEIQEIYMEQDIPGLGKNFMTEQSRLQGIAAYQFGIRLAAARGLISAGGDARPSSGELGWLLDALECEPDAESAARAVMEVGLTWLDLARRSRFKDLNRGVHVLPDYQARHVAPKNDPTLSAMQLSYDQCKKSVQDILRQAFKE